MVLLLPVENNSNPLVRYAKLFTVRPQSAFTTSSSTTLPPTHVHTLLTLCQDLPDNPNPYQN